MWKESRQRAKDVLVAIRVPEPDVDELCSRDDRAALNDNTYDGLVLSDMLGGRCTPKKKIFVQRTLMQAHSNITYFTRRIDHQILPEINRVTMMLTAVESENESLARRVTWLMYAAELRGLKLLSI